MAAQEDTIEEHKFSAGRLWLVGDDVLAVDITLDGQPTTDQVQEFIATVSDALGDRPPVGLVTMQAATYFFRPETVEYMEDNSDWFDRVAFVVDDVFQRAAIRTFQYAARDPRPMHVAESFDDAVEWLRGAGREAALERQRL